jgi:CRP-like cAMP-binding protein
MTKKSTRAFNAQAFLDSAGLAKTIVNYVRAEVIFAQGDRGQSVFYIQQGGVKLSVLSKAGREAVVAILGPGDFFGEGCLAGQSVRIGGATAITPTRVLVIARTRMAAVLRKQHTLSDRFIAYMVARNVRIERDLIDQLFNAKEKRLARALLLLARFGKQATPRHAVPTISEAALAQIVGTSRARVSFVMTKFRRLGFIGHDDSPGNGLQINSSLLSVVGRPLGSSAVGARGGRTATTRGKPKR